MLKKLKVLYKALFGKNVEKYEARHYILNWISAKLGFRLGNKNLSWYKDQEYKKLYSKLINSDKFLIHDRKYTLYSIAKNIVNIPGDIAECGVFKGHSSYFMMKANENTGKLFFGFDSFEGLSKPEDIDNINNNHSFKWKKNDMSMPQAIATDNLVDFSNRITLLKGWIPTRFNEVSNHKFSLVHIDVDLYQPTKDSLEFFWERLSDGGVIVCDDYAFETCPGAKKAMDDFFNNKGINVIELTTGQGVVFKIFGEI